MYSDFVSSPLTPCLSIRPLKHSYLLYLPLRNSIYNGTLSVNTGSFLGAGGCARDTAPLLKRPPIVWYGTRCVAKKKGGGGGWAFEG